MDIEEAKKILREYLKNIPVEVCDFHIALEILLSKLERQEKIINAITKDMFCYLDNTISNYKKVNSVEELKLYYEKKVSEE